MVDGRPTPPFGQIVGQAQQALRGLLDDVLEAASVSHPTWLTLNLLAVQGPALPAEQLRRTLADGLRVELSEVSELFRGLEAAGYIELRGSAAGEEVALTSAGSALYRDLRAGVDRLSASALAGIPQQDIETTVNVLTRAREQAQNLCAARASA